MTFKNLPSKIPYLETTGMPTRILLRKRRFKCYHCSKMMVAETPLVKKNHQIPRIINQKIAQKLIEKISMTDIAHQLAISTSTVIRKLNDFHFEHDFSRLPKIMSWDEYAFTKGKMSFIAQDFDNLNIITVLEGRTQAVIRNHFLKYDRAVRCRVKIITMDMFSPYYDLARQLFPCAKIVLDRFHIVQHLSRAMSRVRVQIMNQFHRKSHEYKAIKRYWKLIQQDSRKLSDKRFYRPTFRMHLTNKEILNKLLSYSEDLKHHYQLYQLLLFHFQNKEPEKFFGFIEDNLKQVHPLFQTVFKTFLKNKEKIVNALQLPYSNAKLEATNNLIKLIKRNAFGFRNFENFKKRIFIADEYAFTKGKMSFIAQDFDNLNIITVLEGRTQAVIRNHFLRYDRAVRCQVKIITMDMFSPYYDLAKQLFPCAKIVLDRFHIIQHLSRAMSRFRVQIMNQFERKSHEYKAIKRYWKLIQQDSRKLSDKRFYRPTFRMHLTNKEILDKILSYSEDLKHHYQIYQLLLFHFQNKEPEKFFGLIEDNLKQVHPLFQTVFKTFLKNKEKIVNALQLHYSNAKLEATNNLIKLIKRNAFGFRNFENFKKRIFIALNIKKERTKFVLSQA
ncbi:IS1167, transposase [Streptococcus pneumoniae]|nr:IS1167, transposase [Streptococcus pneumoniae]